MTADDQQLIADCLQGRSAAFGELVSRYQDRLYNTVFRLVENAEDAQDVVQEVFLSCYQSLGILQGRLALFHLALSDCDQYGHQLQAETASCVAP